MTPWARIPVEIRSEDDRCALTAILVSAGLEVRVARVRETPKGTARRFVKFREQEETCLEN